MWSDVVHVYKRLGPIDKPKQFVPLAEIPREYQSWQTIMFTKHVFRDQRGRVKVWIKISDLIDVLTSLIDGIQPIKLVDINVEVVYG